MSSNPAATRLSRSVENTNMKERELFLFLSAGLRGHVVTLRPSAC